MKRLLLPATAIAIMIAPAITSAAPYQGQASDYRSEPAHAQPAPSQSTAARAAYQPAPRISQPQVAAGHAMVYRQPYVPQGGANGQPAHGQYSGQPGIQYRAPYSSGYQARQTPPRFAPRGQDYDHAFDRGHDGYRDAGDGHARAWWNGRQGFGGYEGRRNGYWYAPGRGYYRPGDGAYAYGWSIGAFVPYDLRGYYVEDPYDYGVGPAPYGYRWIFLDDELVLIDLRTGLIVQVADPY